MLIPAFNIGGNGTWRSVGSGEGGKESEIVLQSVLPEWDFELKNHIRREREICHRTQTALFWSFEKDARPRRSPQCKLSEGTCVTGLWGCLMPLGWWRSAPEEIYRLKAYLKYHQAPRSSDSSLAHSQGFFFCLLTAVFSSWLLESRRASPSSNEESFLSKLDRRTCQGFKSDQNRSGDQITVVPRDTTVTH